MVVRKKIKNILVVDDDQTVVTLLTKTLTDRGYEVLAANGAAEGLELAMKKKLDLVILDVMMPIINGFNFCRLMKQEEEKKDIPIILLTSRGQLKDIEIGLEMGAEAYLVKPLNIDKLFKTINVIESSES